MKMDGGWEDHLHTSFYGEHVLFPGLLLTSFGTFVTASAITILICLAERSLTFALSQHWSPFRAVRQSRARTSLWRASLYWMATLLRLCVLRATSRASHSLCTVRRLYMLLSMTFHVWLITIIVTSLAVGQFFIEYYDLSHSPEHRDAYYLLSPTSSPKRHRPRAKSKPAGLFIHPNESNLARADAAAVELGLHGSTERVSSYRVSADDGDGVPMWEHGSGRDVARTLLGGNAHAHARSDSQSKLFRVADSDSDDDGRP
ncbi:hypothetical protein BC834DRAFT_41495 [Gloeopeniophorella convolvens]|nr:hypothetical protein BC834DRAFT_41495 [Gloeopeniophorella convolvens]